MKMKKWSSQWTQFMQLRKEAWKKKIQDLNGVWRASIAYIKILHVRYVHDLDFNSIISFHFWCTVENISV